MHRWNVSLDGWNDKYGCQNCQFGSDMMHLNAKLRRICQYWDTFGCVASGLDRSHRWTCFIWPLKWRIWLPKLPMWTWYDALERYIASYMTRLRQISWYNLRFGQMAAVDKPYRGTIHPYIRENMQSYRTQCGDPPKWGISEILGDIWCHIWANIGPALQIRFCHAQTDLAKWRHIGQIILYDVI